MVVADGNALSRRGLVTVLRDGGFQVVGEATTASWALQMVQAKSPDVLLAASDLPNSETWALIPTARRSVPALAVVVMAPARSDEALFQALADGASGFVARSSMPATILAVIAQSVAAPTAFTAEDLMAAQRRRTRARTPRLSSRELEVLNLLAEGLTVAGVASRLYIAESTAKSHVNRIYVKLGVGSRTQAILAAMQLGLITAPTIRR